MEKTLANFDGSILTRKDLKRVIGGSLGLAVFIFGVGQLLVNI